MLWRKTWQETRWIFLIGVAVLSCGAVLIVMLYPRAAELMRAAPDLSSRGELGRELSRAFALVGSFRGYAWSQWFAKTQPQMWTVFAAMAGSGGLVAEATTGSALFTLSLPISRFQLLASRSAVLALQLLVLALVPSLLALALAPAVGGALSLLDVLVYGLCLFTGGLFAFSLSTLLATLFSARWPPIWVTLMLMASMVFIERALGGQYGLARAMTGQSWFLRGELPWASLAVSLVASALMFATSARALARRDF